MAQRVEEEGTRFSDPNDFQSQVAEYLRLRDSISFMETRKKELHAKIFAQIESEGEETSSGSVSLYLDAPIGEVARVQKTRRTKRVLDETVADAIIEATGIGDDVYEMKRVINEGALMSALYEEKITEEQLDEMFPVKVTWALDVLKN
jgi:hypothetical protein